MKMTKFVSMVFLPTLALSVSATPSAEWTAYTHSLGDGDGFVVFDEGSGSQTWYPRCADGSEFRFYVREPESYGDGGSKKMLIYLTQGGACWEYNGCVLSRAPDFPLGPLYFPNIPDGTSPFNPAVFDPTFQPEKPTDPPVDSTFSTGILDPDNPENPYQDFIHVVVPYCTGDVHWGHSDCDYDIEGGTTCYEPGTKEGDTLTRHRGFDNLQFVAQTLSDEYGNTDMDTVVLAGSSSGGYGVIFAYPLFREIWPDAEGRLVADGAVGILGDPLYQTALLGDAQDLRGNWNIAATAPDVLLNDGVFTGTVEELPVAAYRSLAYAYPDDRFATYSSAFDVVQALFLNISNNPDDPASWANPLLLSSSIVEFTARARLTVRATSFAHNYKFYLGAGGPHVVLTDPSDLRIPISRNLYGEESAGATFWRPGKKLTAWLEAMNDPNSSWYEWRNLTCAPRCADGTVLQALEVLQP